MALIRANTSGGGGSGNYSLIDSYATSSTYSKNYTISNKAGSKLLVLAMDWGSSATYYGNRFDGVTTNDGSTITNLGHLSPPTAQNRIAGTFYQVNVKTNTCTLTASENATWDVLEMA